MTWVDTLIAAIPGAFFGIAAIINSIRTHSSVNGKLSALLELKDHLADTATNTALAAAAAKEAAAYLRGQEEAYKKNGGSIQGS